MGHTESRQITPLVGVEITGADPVEVATPAGAAELRRLLAERSVVVYRDLHIDDETLLALGRLCGELVSQPTGEHEHPEIQVITLRPDVANPAFLAYRRGNWYWHIDGTTDPYPQEATFLTARAIDDIGQGGTEFASLCDAYEALPADEQERLATLEVVHSFHAAQSTANPDATDDEREIWKRRKPRTHPLVHERPDGRRTLMIGVTADHVVGLPADESRALLDQLEAFATQDRFTLRHDWHPGDLVVWDNVSVLHRAMPFEPTSPRLMHRITLKGHPPVAEREPATV